jgi:hypothetical protein
MRTDITSCIYGWEGLQITCYNQARNYGGHAAQRPDFDVPVVGFVNA